MKIITTSNFGIESVADRLVASNITRQEGEYLVECLNNWGMRSSGEWYCLIEDDARLWRGMEDLV